MALFDNIKKAFGFSDNEEEINNSEYIPQGPYINPFKKEENTDETIVDKKKIRDEYNGIELILPGETIEELLNIINSSLPDFIKKCIDIEAEKQSLNALIGSSVAQYAEKIKQNAIQSLELNNEKEKLQLQNKNAELKQILEDNEAKLKEIKNLQLSNDRQKRSLNERIVDLEKQISKFEADTEQLELEKMSLLNKLKVSQVKTEDSEYFKNENTRLLEELNKIKQQKELEVQASISKKDNLNNEIENIKKELEEKNDKIVELTSELILNKSNNENLKELAIENNNLKEKIAELNVITRENSSLKEKIRLNSEELQSLHEELDEANSALEVVREVQDQLEKVEDMKKRKDSKIERLMDDIKVLEEENNSLQTLVSSLRSEIKEKSALKEEKKIEEIKISTKPKKKNTIEIIDMTALEDTSIISDIDNEYEKINKDPRIIPLVDNDRLQINEVHGELDETPTISLFEPFVEDESPIENKKEPISAISLKDDNNWMNYTPATIPIPDEDNLGKEAILKKEIKEADDSLQMSLF